jgi:hypothetical protein
LAGKASLLVIDPRPGSWSAGNIGGHPVATTSCLTMGPRLITCGQELDGQHTVKIWGTASYVRQERSREQLLAEGHPRPAYYRTLF